MNAHVLAEMSPEHCIHLLCVHGEWECKLTNGNGTLVYMNLNYCCT